MDAIRSALESGNSGTAIPPARWSAVEGKEELRAVRQGNDHTVLPGQSFFEQDGCK
jgi:hypothetical protein